MQLVMGSLLSQRTNAEVFLSSVHAEHDHQLYHQYGFSTVQSSRSNPWKAAKQIVLLLMLRVLRIPFSARLARLDQELAVIHNADLVIDLSGDMLTESHGVKLALSHALPLCSSLLLGKKLYICAQSLGPFNKVKWLYKRVLSQAEIVTVRESISSRILEEIGVSHELTADLAFLAGAIPMGECGDSPALALSTAAKLDNLKQTIGLTLSPLAEHIYRQHTGRDLVHDTARALEQFDANILLIPHVMGPRRDQDDRETLRRFAGEVGMDCLLLSEDREPQEIRSIIAKCDLFIGARMHACIAAASQGVPTIALAYSHKARGVMEMLGIPEYALPLDASLKDQLEGTIRGALCNLDDLRYELRNKREEVARHSDRNIQIAVNLISLEK